nr:mapk-regulated corepressor-interacting protein 1-like isoform X1 [Oncorhynchus gorbuscha]
MMFLIARVHFIRVYNLRNDWLALATVLADGRPSSLTLVTSCWLSKERERKPNLKTERSKRQTAHRMSSSAPRMVNNYKRTSSPRSPTNSGELFTPAHEENVRFIHDTWQCVLRDIRSPQSSERKDRGPQEYVEKNPNPNLNSFTPVDLSDLKKRNTQDSKKS